jgi:tight adherence protein B
MLPLLVGLVAAIGVLMVTLVLAGGSTVGARLERYAGSSSLSGAGEPVRRSPLGGLLARLAGLPIAARAERVIGRRDFGARLSDGLLRADVALRPGEFALLWLACVAGVPAAIVTLGPLVGLGGNPLLALLGVVFGLVGPRLWLSRRQRQRVRAFEAHLADTITLLANGLRAGSSFLQSVELIVRETEPPISTEFSRLIREINVGLPLDDALVNLRRRIASADLELMTTAISIQHSVGGNLADILDSIALTIRERVRIQGEIRVLTAQQRLSGYVVGLMPVALVGILAIISPHYLEPLFRKPPEAFGIPLGVLMLAFGGLVMLIGFAIIRRIVDIKV